MSLSVGIVGLPNVGKSTLFNAILKKEQALSANYPFATIEPNVGTINVPDRRLDVLADLINQDEGVLPPKIYATIQMIDIAGLIKGASKGEGLGNQFLANIRETDMILEVVRNFRDENIIREQSTTPENDIEIVNSELILKDIETLEKRLKAAGKSPIGKKESELVIFYLEELGRGSLAFDLRSKIDPIDYKEIIQPLFLLTDKEFVYAFNVDEDHPSLRNNEVQIFNGKAQIFISAKLEAELASLSEEDQSQYLTDLGIPKSGLDKVAQVCFEKLGLISFLTAGPKEVRAWEIHKGTTAQEAAGTIHTDFAKNFIKAEVINFEDYQQFGNKLKAKEAGRLRLEGKDYIVKDGDVIEFKVGSGH